MKSPYDLKTWDEIRRKITSLASRTQLTDSSGMATVQTPFERHMMYMVLRIDRDNEYILSGYRYGGLSNSFQMYLSWTGRPQKAFGSVLRV